MSESYHIEQPPLYSSKVCPVCHIEKPLDAFQSRGPGRGRKPQSWCKACTNEQRRLKRQALIQNPPERTALTSQICTRCDTLKPINDFYADPVSKTGYRASCKECKDHTDKRTKNLGKRRRMHSLPVIDGYMRCWICEDEKPLSEFNQMNGTRSGYDRYCTSCRKGMRHAQWQEAREYVLPQWRARWQTISDEERERYNAYNRKNSKKPQARLKNAEKRRRREARKRETQSDPVEYQAILKRDGHWCYICEKDIDPTITKGRGRLTFDHKIPLTPFPGDPQGTHTEENIHPVHKCCNERKQNRRFENLTPSQRRGPT